MLVYVPIYELSSNSILCISAHVDKVLLLLLLLYYYYYYTTTTILLLLYHYYYYLILISVIIHTYLYSFYVCFVITSIVAVIGELITTYEPGIFTTVQFFFDICKFI